MKENNKRCDTEKFIQKNILKTNYLRKIFIVLDRLYITIIVKILSKSKNSK